MLIDTHCHIDQYQSPEDVVRECEKRALRVVAVTNLPSHFSKTADRLRGYNFVTPALGMHPLFASKSIRELATFKRMAPHANYIGEIGLDCSRQGEPSMAIQERVFEEVLGAIADRPRFITLHSRGAEKAVLAGLRRHNIRDAVFHWFTGSSGDFGHVIDSGHFVSINPAMLTTVGGKRIIASVPREAILVESDGPFTKIEGRISHPQDIAVVYDALATQWRISVAEVAGIVTNNFNKIVRRFGG